MVGLSKLNGIQCDKLPCHEHNDIEQAQALATVQFTNAPLVEISPCCTAQPAQNYLL